MIDSVSTSIASTSIDWSQLLIQSSIITILVTLFTSLFLAKINNEYAIRRSFFGNNIDTIFKYYTIFYEYYRLCQKVTNADIVRNKDGSEISTRDIYINNLDSTVNKWLDIEGKIQLILPEKLLQIHHESVDKFNNFRHTMKSYSKDNEKPKKRLKSDFEEINEIKDNLKKALKEYLRAEKVLK